MAFSTANSRVPTSIGKISILLVENPRETRIDGEVIVSRKILYEVEVLDADGVPMRVRGDAGDLVPHLTTAQKSALLDFVQDMRLKAEAEILP